MTTYTEMMKLINDFLVQTNKLQSLSETLFQGVFIKKLSNSNLVSNKKYINKATGTKTHQSHLDLTGQNTLNFFFGNKPTVEKEYTQIMIDIPVDNLNLVAQLDISQEVIKPRGRKKEDCVVLKRKIPASYVFTPTSNLFHYAYAFKKLEGHSGKQNQINRLQNKDEFFELCSHAYENDLLVLMKHTLNHYICVLIPSEYATSITAKMDSNINYSVSNPAYDPKAASDAFCNIMKKNAKKEFSEIDTILKTQSKLSGHDREQLVKVRIGQGSFRKLLIEQRGCSCELCNITLPEVLRASHIQSWSDSDANERMDLQNGLLLCANHDALFDRHMISFDPDTADLLISSSINDEQISELKLDNVKKINISAPMKKYMKNHNALFEK